jgi:hypothetical protein
MEALIRLALTLSILSGTSALASTVHRCEGANGAITFTDLGCANDALMSIQQAYNPPPGGGQAGLLPERERNGPKARGKPSEGARVTIVDSRETAPATRPRSRSQTAKSPR